MKTKEELNAIKEEVEALNKKLRELTDEELLQVAGGFTPILKAGHSTATIVEKEQVNEEQENILGCFPIFQRLP